MDAPAPQASEDAEEHPEPEPPDQPEPPEQLAPTGGRPHLPIAGIGASAGGLAALQQLVERVEAGYGIAYVVVTHQAPGRVTLLPELLARSAHVPVRAVQDGVRLLPDEIYVASSGCRLELHDGALRVTELDASRPVLPIDHFFRSLAAVAGEHAIAIVLSGNGSDGTIGACEVKAASGLVIAQDPQTAQYTGMPTSAIATQIVDYVLAPSAIPEQLARYVHEKNLAAGRLPGLDDHASAGALEQILLILRSRNGNDFRAYKTSTTRRRIARRMHVRGIADPAEYARFLEATPYEAEALFKELLISVTGFFRDPPAFEALEQQLAALIDGKDAHTPLRAWIAGCATGEEAYSLAIIIREMMHRSGKPLRAQIFATDLDPQAIETARAGHYPEGIVADVRPDRLQRFFTRDEGGYRVAKDVRELIVFAVQNTIKDPPFTGLDLLSCRNLLIYLESDLQKRLLALFGYALRPGGLLLLGTSESITGFDDRFVALDKRWKLFRRTEAMVTRTLPAFPADLPTLGDQQRALLPRRERSREPAAIGHAAEKTLLDQFVPPSIVVDERGELLYTHGRVGRFFEPPPGEPSHNAFHMAREGLRLELPAAVRKAAASGEPVVRRGVRVKDNGGHCQITLTARRLREPDAMRGSVLVSFEIERERAKPVEPKPAARHTRGRSPARVAVLEKELQHTRETLQGTIEQLETSNEELKSTNEELQSTNEELQSANEELETSREEMQSLNEELQTVNAELEERNRALSQANDDMQNLLNSTAVATLFLDNQLAIKRFTVEAKKVFNLIGSDVGRPIADLTVNLRYDRLVEDAREVQQTLVFREREVQTKDGGWRQMRIMPYRTFENMIDGIVVTFVDIDRLKRAERIALSARAFAEDIIESLHQGVLLLDEQQNVVSTNRAFCQMFRIERERVVGASLERLFEGSMGLAEIAARLRVMMDDESSSDGVRVEARIPRTEGVQDLVFSIRRMKPEAGRLVHMILTIEPAPIDDSAVLGW